MFSLCSNEIYITHGPCGLATKLRFYIHPNAHLLPLDTDQSRQEQRVHAFKLDECQCKWHILQKFLGCEVTNGPRMDPTFLRQLKPFCLAAAIHAMHARRRITVIALRAETSEQFAFLQRVEEGRVLLVAVDVIHLEVRADGEWINSEHFRAAINLRKFWILRHNIANRQAPTSRIRTNIQHPTSNIQRNSKHQSLNWNFEFGASLQVGAWCLEFEASLKFEV